MLSWIPDADATGSSGSTVRAGVLTFLAAQHGGTRINGVTMHFVPLGLTGVAVWLCWRAGRVLHALPIVRADLRHGRIAAITALQMLGYLLTCAILTPFSVIGTSSVPALGAIVGAVAVSALGFGLAAARCTPLGGAGWERLPEGVRAAVPAAGGSVAVLVGAGAVLAAGATALHAGRFLDLSRGLSRGLSGLPIAALDLLSAPNAVLASTSYIIGPGFAVGVHSAYAPFGGTAGLVPAFPVLAGLPAGSNASVPVLVLMVLAIAGSGSVAGLLVLRSAPGLGWLRMLGACMLAGAGTGAVLGVLAAAAGGSLGSRNLRAVGASPWQVALLAAAEVGLVAAPVAAVARLLVARSRPRAERSPRLSAITGGTPDRPTADGPSAPAASAPAASAPAASAPAASAPAASAPAASAPAASDEVAGATGRQAAS